MARGEHAGLNFQVLLPLLAPHVRGGGGTYGGLTAAMGAGAIVGALAAASRGPPGAS